MQTSFAADIMYHLAVFLAQFMLQLEEVEGLKQQLLPWHKDPTQPLVIEVGPTDSNQRFLGSGSSK